MESPIESHQETKDVVQTEYVENSPAYERKTMSERFQSLKHSVTTRDGWLGDYDYGFLCMPRIPFLTKRTNTPPFFGLNTNLPILLAIFLGFQHCLAMVSGVVTPSLILSGAGTGNLNLPADYQQYMISSALIVTAIGSAIQITAFRYRGFQLGTGLLSVVGTTFTIIPLAQSVFANMYKTGYCPTSTAADGTVTNLACPAGYGALLGTSMICSLLPMALSFLPPRTLKKMFPPIVTGTTVFLIGLSLVTAGFQSWGGGAGPCVSRPESGFFSVCSELGAPNAAPWGDPRWIGLGFLVYISIILIEYFGSPFLKNIQVVVGFVIGIIVAAATGYIDHSKIDSAPVITFLWVKTFPISVYGPAVIPMLIVYLVSVVEAVGDITASCDASRIAVEGPEFEKRIKGGILVDGINSLMAACATSTPLVTFAQNNGVIALTRCANRAAGYWCCIFLFLMGIFGKFAGVFLAVPDAVLGGMTTFLFSTVAVAGIRILSYLKWTRRERFIVSAAMTIGLGVNLVPNWFNYVLTYSGSNLALRGFLDSIQVIVSTGFCIAAIIATILNATLPLDTDIEEMEHLNGDHSSVDASL
ncbi:permease family-domain-containing protein [Umbelopsis sp. AD052]|nr:permease family-domain-containing protein [Umbelopsis sp. AD052]